MQYARKAIPSRLIRFLVVGAGNTAINFAVLNLTFYILHQGKLESNLIATACAITFSFPLNRSFVFANNGQPAKKLAHFLFISAIGTLLVQSATYALCIALLRNRMSGAITTVHWITPIRLEANFVDINLSNLIASFVVMFWNYNGYRLLVFNTSREGDEVVESFNAEAS